MSLTVLRFDNLRNKVELGRWLGSCSLGVTVFLFPFARHL